jgi:hypothetical protein
MKIILTDEDRKLILKLLEVQTRTHDERGRTRRLVNAFELKKIKGDDRLSTFEIDDATRKAGEEICKGATIQGNPFIQAAVYDLGEKFTALEENLEKPLVVITAPGPNV